LGGTTIAEGKTQNSAYSGEGDEKVFSVRQNASQPISAIRARMGEYKVPADTIEKSRPSPLLDHRGTGKKLIIILRIQKGEEEVLKHSYLDGYVRRLHVVTLRC